MSSFKLQPLALHFRRNKILPALPQQPAAAAELKEENKALSMEVQQLRSQQEILSDQIRRYYRITEAYKAFVRETTAGVQHIHNSAITMEEAKRAADYPWMMPCDTKLETQMTEEKVGNWI
jgi:hypothetical protein